MIDLRSDTLTQPSPSMRKAMAQAETGDDVLREDPTVLALERRAAELTGKEAALFTPSGTFANQLALFTWVPPGGEVYVSESAHIVQHEAGAAACISSAFLRTFVPANDCWTQWKDLQPRLRPERDQHSPVSSLICLENALSNGKIHPIESMAEIMKSARQVGIPVHLDGARLFNAASTLNVEAKCIADQTDSLMFCLSKGLGAPVGSILCGPKDFIHEAFYKRKIMGGGMRQVGILAAAGLVALEEQVPRLKEDHELAQILAKNFAQYDDVFELLTPYPEINMVFLRLHHSGKEKKFLKALSKAGILTYPPENGVFRFVTHCDINPKKLHEAMEKLPSIVDNL